MPNRLFQGVVNQMQHASGKNIGVVDENGVVVACSNLGSVGQTRHHVISDGVFSGVNNIVDGAAYKPFGDSIHPEYAVFVEGSDDESRHFADIIAVALQAIKESSDDKFDRVNFVKNVMLENILPGDIFAKSQELHFNNEAVRVVFIIRVAENHDVPIYDIIQGYFPDKSKDFVLNINATDIVIVKEVRRDMTLEDFENLARSLIDTLSSEYMCDCVVGIGSRVTGIKDISRSFREAKIALEVGKVFDTKKSIASYEHLGIARLIYQLPTTVCRMYLNEVFEHGSIKELDQETLFTIHKFFENDLNVSETSRKLFVHRNTLVYRLEKIKKVTGLDLRKFDDAIVFKVALMVNKYLETSPIKY